MPNSTDTIRAYIDKNLTGWSRNPKFKKADILTTPLGEEILVSYENINITGTDRSKPQIRVFLEDHKTNYAFAKNNNMRFFLLTIFTQNISFATGLNNFIPSDYIVSIETNLEPENSRRDLRSLYDYLNSYIATKGLGVSNFVRCTQPHHSSGIYQAAFIRIKEDAVDEPTQLLNYLQYFDSRPYVSSSASTPSSISALHNFVSNCSLNFPYNRIVFGAPGTGKSYLLENNRIGKDQNGSPLWAGFDNRYERVTFHPNYSYSQFVGTYKPVTSISDGEETIKYKFVPGPFLRILVNALNSIISGENKPFLLLIEEINRANVAAVFGDTFQLLDRKSGVSEYAIHTSEDIREYLSEKLSLEAEALCEIRIPDNMYIWSTMNSADQGVFPLDTAFKRRWEFEYIGIDDDCSGMQNVTVVLPNGHKVKWDTLRRKINEILSSDRCRVNEDKLIGPYFISKEVILEDEATHEIIDNEKFIFAFKRKILMYLFEDVAKLKIRDLFSGCDNTKRLTYADICKEFDSKGEEIFEIGLDLSI